MTEAISLFPYQEAGAKWLSSRTLALLADEMGLGKSAQAITAADDIKANRVLVLCPASVRINWLREFEKFSATSRQFKIIASKTDVAGDHESAICSYDLADPSRLPGTFDLLILDEAHFLKSTETNRTVAVYGRDGLIRKASRTWALSGTPMPNHPGELWPILFTFGRTPLPYDSFVDRFCTHYPGPRGEKRVTGAKSAHIPELRQLLSGIMLRRKKEDVMKELPPISFQDIVVEPGPVDLELESSFLQYVFPEDRRKELAEKLEKERALLSSIEGVESLGRAAAYNALASLSQSVSTLRRYTGIQKVENTAKVIAEELKANAYEKVVIFAIHRDVIEGMRVKLRDFKPVTLYGGTEPETRQKNIDKFQKTKKCRVFIGNILAAGTGITLTAAHNVVFVEQDWVPGNNAQAAMRCHRIGQTSPVTVRFVGLANSIDERISSVLKRKTKDAVAIFDDRGIAKNETSEYTPDQTDNTEGEENEYAALI